MNRSEYNQEFDYSYFISLGGIGLLFSFAAIMVGMGYGNPYYGFMAAAAIMLFVVIILFFMLKKAKKNFSLLSYYFDLSRKDISNVAMMMTSVVGDVIFANPEMNILFEKYKFGPVQFPLRINISNKKTLENMLNNLTIGKKDFIICEVGNTGIYLKFEIEKIHKNGNFYVWKIFEDVKDRLPINSEGLSLNNHMDMSDYFNEQHIGFITINKTHNITHANGSFLKLIFNENDNPKLPFELSMVSHHSQKNLKGSVHFFNKEGDTVDAFVTCWRHGRDNDGLSYYLVMPDEKNSLKVNSNQNYAKDDIFFRNSPIGIAVVNEQGDILEKNIIFSNFVAALELEKYGNLKDILAVDTCISVFKVINETFKTNKPSKIVELTFQGLSDKQGQFYITNSGSVSDDNKEVIIYLIDITEQKSLELQFSQSQKMQAVGQLAGGIAHDFNNLLTAITGFSDLLLVKHGPGDQSFSDIIQIKQNANRAANLVRQLLAFSRQQTLQPKILIMTDVIAELSNLLRRLIGTNIDLEIKHGRDLAPVRVDQGQLEQVIINLCVNARDAMPEGGKLEIITKNINAEETIQISEHYPIFPKGDYVLLEVKDNGTGIAKEHIDKVFEPFFSTKEVGKGTGLGLSTVYGIIKQTDGYIFPESEMGIGTSFKIYLPHYAEGEVEAVDSLSDIIKPAEFARDLTGNSTILLVEDEDAVRMFAARALKNKGYTVYEADCGVTALQVLKDIDVEIDLLISDVMMPQMDGPSLVKKIRESDKDLKVIFISGYAEDALDDNIMDKDFHFLSKPFSLKQLAEQVKEVLEK